MSRVRRVVFLDFDGVVVCKPKDESGPDWGKIVRNAQPGPVALLNRVLDETGAYVVVSSSWRHNHSVADMYGTLRRAGFTGRIVDVTPTDYTAERGDEIAAWLKAHPVESYVVLDDDADKGSIPAERWVLVKDGWFSGGLTESHANVAIALLRIPV